MPHSRSLVLVTALSCCVVLASCASSQAPIDEGSAGPTGRPLPQGTDTQVKRVVDGDTLVIANGDRVRLIGIDTPESVKPDSPVECFGVEASSRTKALLPTGTPIRLQRDREPKDRFGRTLAYVFRTSDGLFVNANLLEDGYARTLTIRPNTAYEKSFAAAQSEAKKARRGLWGSCSR